MMIQLQIDLSTRQVTWTVFDDHQVTLTSGIAASVPLAAQAALAALKVSIATQLTALQAAQGAL